jgi:uncharacterized membrane protein (DUF373 family)
MADMATRFLDRFERLITYALLVLIGAVVVLATAELAWLLAKDVLTPPLFLLEIEELQELFGQFLLVLIGIELMYTLRLYIEDRSIHLEAVLAVALIAVARKIIVVEPKDLPPGALFAVAAMVVGLAIGHYLVQRGRQ